MPRDIEDIFRATSQSIWNFMVKPGQGSYIPPYQRVYAWENQNISRLFEDVLDGLRQLEQRPDVVSFLGTLIAIHDTDYLTVEPIVHGDVPTRVMTIIDGQQRLSTVVMANIALHDQIQHQLRALDARVTTEPTEPHIDWVRTVASKLLADLRDTYLMDQRAGEIPYRYYPRIISAYRDVWSSKSASHKYSSPIACVVWRYIQHTELVHQSTAGLPFAFHPQSPPGESADFYATIEKKFAYIQNQIGGLCQPGDLHTEFPDLLSLTDLDRAGSLWNGSLICNVCEYIGGSTDDPVHEHYCNLVRLTAFGRYLNHRTAITVVTTKDEEDAFDIFEALNTTGEPLTAFETLKPKVIAVERLADYKRSPSHEAIATIEAYLQPFVKSEQRQAATSNMLVPFALAETATKLPKKLGPQRAYLRKQYDSLRIPDDLDPQRSFLKSLATLTQFLGDGWDVKKRVPGFSPLTIGDSHALVAFRALQDLNHTITIAPLFRFYQHAVRVDQPSQRIQRTSDLVAAILATTAFSMLWRGAHGRTANIDSCYRDVMGTASDSASFALARRHPKSTGSLDLEAYKQALRGFLRTLSGIKTRADWIRKVLDVDLYTGARNVARFLLFCASDDAVPDSSRPGLIQRGRPGVAPMLDWVRWNSEEYFTVEHIAPQSRKVGWQANIYAEERTIHTLGNLILLPRDANSVVSNRPWATKRLMYALLASETPAEFGRIKKQLERNSVPWSEKATAVVEQAKYLGMCKSVSLCRDWSQRMIKHRGERVAELAWERLAPWLGF